jgi:hypothetical protein
MADMQTNNNNKSKRKDRKDPIKVGSFTSKGILKEIIDKAKLINTINNTVIAILPDVLTPYFKVINHTGNKIIIKAASATHCTLIKYQEEKILNALAKNELCNFIKEIQVVIKPS